MRYAWCMCVCVRIGSFVCSRFFSLSTAQTIFNAILRFEAMWLWVFFFDFLLFVALWTWTVLFIFINSMLNLMPNSCTVFSVHCSESMFIALFVCWLFYCFIGPCGCCAPSAIPWDRDRRRRKKPNLKMHEIVPQWERTGKPFPEF